MNFSFRIVHTSRSHLRKPSVRFSLTLISPLADFKDFPRLQIVVLLSFESTNQVTPYRYVHFKYCWYFAQKKKTISSAAVGVYKQLHITVRTYLLFYKQPCNKQLLWRNRHSVGPRIDTRQAQNFFSVIYTHLLQMWPVFPR